MDEFETIEAEELLVKLQRKVNRAANRAVVFSVLWLGGIGSFLAIYFGIKTLKLLKENAETNLRGKGKAIFGIIMGSIGTLLFIFWWYAIITGDWTLSDY